VSLAHTVIANNKVYINSSRPMQIQAKD